jgi:molecular chaperone HtpG
VIDSADLPLNVSRELLQESRDVKAIREGSTKRVLACWKTWRSRRRTSAANRSSRGQGQVRKYAFYAEFGAVLKEGLGEDFGNRERMAKLLRFASTTPTR